LRAIVALNPIEETLLRARRYRWGALAGTRGSHEGIIPILRSLGCDDLADPIVAILERPVGDKTVRLTLDLYRNKFIAHPSFDFSRLERDMSPLALDRNDSPGSVAFWPSMRELLKRTDALVVELCRRYPEAVGNVVTYRE